MSNMVEKSSIALKVKNLSKIRSFSSRYRKKKQFCDVLSYQKLHKFQKYQRILKKLKTLQELIYVKSKNADDKEEGEDKTSTTVDEIDHEESFDEEGYSSDEDFLSDSEEDIDGMEEEYPNNGEEWNNMDEEYSSDEELYMEEEEEGSSETEEENPEHTNIPTNENLNEISNIEEIDVSDELNVSEIDGDDIEALMAMQFRDTRLESHIREHNLNLVPREATRNDGNCWYDAIADQVFLHEVPGKHTNHVDLRHAVCEAIPKLPQAKEWIQNIFGDEETFTDFLEGHKTVGTWTDSLGIMCQATALVLKRNIHIVGTANIGQGVAFTKLESVEEANEFPPLTVGYYQDRHYQSLQERPLEQHKEDEEKEFDMSMNSDQVRKMIDEEKLLSQSVFDSDSDFDEIP